MTPAQLAVERDRLLEGGRTLETIGTMQAAAAGELQVRVAVAVRERLVSELMARLRDMRNPYEQAAFDFCAGVIGRVDLTPIIARLSSPETRIGAPEHRPQGETP